VGALLSSKSDAAIEPLFGRRHIWTNLIAQATPSLNIAQNQLTPREELGSVHGVYGVACKNSRLRGGDLLPINRISYFPKKLVTVENNGHENKQIQVVLDLRQVRIETVKLGNVFSVELYYPFLPENVKGFIEFTYTLMGFANLKGIESLSYRLGLHYLEFQIFTIYLAKGNKRPFTYSSSILPSTKALENAQPFHSSVFNCLIKLRTCGAPLEEIASKLGVDGSQTEPLKSFSCEYGEFQAQRQTRPEITRWRYSGHACVSVNTPTGENVLFDPIGAYEADLGLSCFTLADLPEKIDYDVSTHTPADYVVVETLLAIRYKVNTVVMHPSRGQMAEPLLTMLIGPTGSQNVIALDSLESETLSDLTPTAISCLDELGNLDIQTKAAWFVQSGNDKLLFAPDSNDLETGLYESTSDAFGDFNTMLIGMECFGAPFSRTYEPLLPSAVDRKNDQSRRLNGSDFERALKAIEALA